MRKKTRMWRVNEEASEEAFARPPVRKRFRGGNPQFFGEIVASRPDKAGLYFFLLFGYPDSNKKAISPPRIRMADE